VSHLYVLYPNVRIRTELICKCLEILCDFATRADFAEFLRERQLAHYGSVPLQEGQIPHPSRSHTLEKNIDFYAVEIKAKIIAIYFKYF